MWRRTYRRLTAEIERIDEERMVVLYEAATAIGLFRGQPLIRSDGSVHQPRTQRRASTRGK